MSKDKLDVKIGQEVLVVGVGNNARHSIPKIKGVITKLGRKWFTLETPDSPYVGEREKFSLENGMCDGGEYNSEWRVYLSEEEFDEDRAWRPLYNKLNEKMRHLSYKQLRQIEDLIDSLVQ